VTLLDNQVWHVGNWSTVVWIDFDVDVRRCRLQAAVEDQVAQGGSEAGADGIRSLEDDLAVDNGLAYREQVTSNPLWDTVDLLANSTVELALSGVECSDLWSNCKQATEAHTSQVNDDFLTTLESVLGVVGCPWSLSAQAATSRDVLDLGRTKAWNMEGGSASSGTVG